MVWTAFTQKTRCYRNSHLSRPVVIGLTGGVASGKSTVANMFQRLGASVLDGDQVGHEVLNDPDVLSQILSLIHI